MRVLRRTIGLHAAGPVRVTAHVRQLAGPGTPDYASETLERHVRD